MNIGDKVRGIHSNDEGIVTKILKGGLVEIEIEEGFTIPYPINELVQVSKTEAQKFDTKSTEVKKSPKAEKGFYLALRQLGDKIKILLINNTDFDIVGTLHFFTKENYNGLTSFSLSPKSDIDVDQFFELSQFSKKSYFLLSYLNFKKGISTPSFLNEKRINTPDNKILTKGKTMAPLIEEEAIVFQIDEKSKVVTGNDIKNAIQVETIEKSNYSKDIKYPKNNVIDLHIEKLSPNPEFISNKEKINLQISTFEKELNLALTSNADTITFIHGIGSGSLKHQIQKKLSEHPHVKFYEDAEKTKFGYGATKATIN